MTTPTQEALRALRPEGEVVASTLSLAQRAVDGVSRLLQKRTSRRGFLVRAGVVGSALAMDPIGYVLKPGTAYAAVCGPGSSCGSGWTVFCTTINNGVNACPPGSIAAGWWKADGASLCGGKARYIVDCNATCSKCTSPGARAGICSSSCWSCSCRCGPTSSCDQRKVCCNAFRYGQCNTQVRQVGGVHCRVVSCTPPWKFEACTTSPATDNRTRDHNSDSLPQAWTPITARYTALGENGSALGASVYAELVVKGGRAQRYQAGRISYSAATGALEVLGAIAQRYTALGAEAGIMGYPITATAVATGSGRFNRFQQGRISWHPTTGAWETRGEITKRYEALNAERGPLGYPVAAVVNGPDGAGRISRFQTGRITWTAASGAIDVRGDINACYERVNAESGPLGYPVALTEVPADGKGRFQRFQKGRISWSTETGAIETRGDIAAAYLASGAESGALGYPKAVTTAAFDGTGRVQSFQTGRISWKTATGAHWTAGALSARYVQDGAERGLLGYPTSDEKTLDNGRRGNEFERGRMFYDEAGVVQVELVPMS